MPDPFDPETAGFEAIDEAVRVVAGGLMPVALQLPDDHRQRYVIGLVTGALHGGAQIAKRWMGPDWRSHFRTLVGVVIEQVGRCEDRQAGRGVIAKALSSEVARAEIAREKGGG